MLFCAFSYSDRTFSFTNELMCHYAKMSLSACGYECDPELVVRDFRESISIMELDGLTYEFAHRSFQEYFYAKFVVNDRKLKLKEKVDWLTSSFADDTIDMIAEMDRAYFEEEYLLPELRTLNRELRKTDPFNKPYSVLQKFYENLHTAVLGVESGEASRRVYFRVKDSTNVFVWRQCRRVYYDEVMAGVEDDLPGRNIDLDERVDLVDAKFHGEIKIHHTNNKRLLEVGVERHAARLKLSLERLEAHLADLQARRTSGVGSMLRAKYLGEQR
jgi:hypothetical protein